MKRAALILKEKLYNEISPILPLANYQAISRTDNGIEALRMAQRVEPDLILCGWDVSGLSALDLTQNLVQSKICPVILILDPKEYGNIQLAVKTDIHHILTSPVRAGDVIAGIIQAEYRFERDLQYEKEIGKLNDELKTRKLVYQAVLILISSGLGEEEAYSAIRSEAMTSRKTLRSVAGDIIKGTWRPA
ncbi:MAG: putative transcriptional regulatory protein pdtaR [Candidatus Dichloromethanomonas elyunquensis]|nr:MAG: putative transcriptional regulatory protein pdtaR [Candidatus Dichloromethanomonas elyunquensis]